MRSYLHVSLNGDDDWRCNHETSPQDESRLSSNLRDGLLELHDLINMQVRDADNITRAANNPPADSANAPAHLGVIGLCLSGHLASLREIQDIVANMREATQGT